MCDDPAYWERLAAFMVTEMSLLEKKESCQVPLHKPGQNGSSGSSKPVDPSSAMFLTSFADLMEFLCSDVWADGSARQRGTLLITWEKGKWTLKVNDREGNRYAFYAALTLQDALAGVDLGLSTDELDWRDQRPFEDRNRKRG
jgi:hypothetical protein